MKNPVKIYHVHHEHSKGVVTIATEVQPTPNETKLRVGFAFCSPHDKFQRKLGRKIAIGRMKNPTCANCYTTHFSGHSADDVASLWPYIDKPNFWQKTQLFNDESVGLMLK